MKHLLFQKTKVYLIVFIWIISSFLLIACQNQNEEDLYQNISDKEGTVVEAEWKPDKSVIKTESKRIESISSKITQQPKILKKSTRPSQSGNQYTIQVGAFLNKNNALTLIQLLESKGYAPRLIITGTTGKKWHFVRVGSFYKKQAVEDMAERISNEENLEVVIMKNQKVTKKITPPNKRNKKTPVMKIEPNNEKTNDIPNEKASSKPLKHEKYNLYSFQVGGLYSSSTAQKQKEKLKKKGYSPFIVNADNASINETWYSVKIGYFRTFEEAVDAATRFSEKEGIPARAQP